MIKVFYTPEQNAESGNQGLEHPSPSAAKPKQIAAALADFPGVEFVKPKPVTIDDIKLCHKPEYVDGVMNLTLPNGFGTYSQSVNDSLPFTNGAMYDAVRAATVDSPTCALVSGFHHAGYDGPEHNSWFCTFNGLMIAAIKMVQAGAENVAIVDSDYHYGNGTDDILEHLITTKGPQPFTHISFGRHYCHTMDAAQYLDALRPAGWAYRRLADARPAVIIYQAGADVHINDPYGGLFTTEQIKERDVLMFSLAKELGIPIAWDLAGGYQIESDGSIPTVIEIHLNTFRACQEVYGMTPGC